MELSTHDERLILLYILMLLLKQMVSLMSDYTYKLDDSFCIWTQGFIYYIAYSP